MNKVMHYYAIGVTGGGGRRLAHVQHVADSNAGIHYAGRWATAGHPRYTGGRAHWSKQAGATATFTFTGTRIQWFGPVGPTRGQARVSIDGVAVKVVNLHRGSFVARSLLFAKAWSTSGRHTLTIEVVGTAGHALVAVDDLTVRR